MPQVVTIGSGGDYSTVASWVASSDYSTDYGVGNKATGRITGIITEVVTINTADTPNGALLTAFPGEEYDGTNSSTCAGLTSSGITLALRDQGLEVSNIFVETTANTIAVRPGAFEAVDSDIHDIGIKAGLTGNDSAGIETFASAAFTGNIVNVTIEGSGGWGVRLRNDATGTLDHITIVDAAANGSGFRDGFVGGGASVVVTNTLVLLAATASGSAESFAGTFNASSDFNAGDDTTAPGSNSLDNRTTADLANFAGDDFRTASGSALATAGSGGGFIGAFLEAAAGATITPNPIDSAQTITNVTLTQHSAITVNDILTENTISQASLTTGVALSVNPILSDQTLSESSFTQQSTLSTDDIISAQTISSPTFTQANILSVDNLTSGQTLSNVLLSVAGVLQVQGLTNAQVISNVCADSKSSVLKIFC